MNQPITTANRFFPPHNRIAFQNVQQLFPTARVRRGELTEPLTRPVENLPLTEFNYNALNGSTHNLATMLDDTYTDASVVACKGELLHEQCDNGMTASSLHLLNSVTKSITGMTALILMERSLFGIDDLVS